MALSTKLGLGLAASALAIGMAAPAAADELELSGNVAIVSDYSFRGISQTDLDPAVQGGIDATYGLFYIGTWGSAVDFAPMELDLYAGIAPTVGEIDLDFGVIGYFYPGADDDGAEFDYVEVYAGAGHDFGPLAASVGAAYSPDYFGESGDFFYVSGGVSVPLPADIALDASLGYSAIDDNGAFGTPDYLDWTIALSYTYDIVTGTVAYVGTDIDDVDCFGDPDPDLCGDRVIVSLSASF